jgi:hypothetical protein
MKAIKTMLTDYFVSINENHFLFKTDAMNLFETICHFCKERKK